MLACDEPRSTLQHESISAELHGLCAWRVSMLARETAALAAWGRGRVPGIARRQRAVNTGTRPTNQILTNAFQKTPFYFFSGRNHILKMPSKNPFLFFFGEKPHSKNEFIKNPFQ